MDAHINTFGNWESAAMRKTKSAAMRKAIAFSGAVCYIRFIKLNRDLQGRVKFPIGGKGVSASKSASKDDR